MKISFKRMLGLAAIGGAIAYARKHGGFKNAFYELKEKVLAKKDELAAKASTANAGTTSQASNISGTAYTGGGNDDFGGTYTRR
jgi:hypothetical protein